jgi:hypothetical protein
MIRNPRRTLQQNRRSRSDELMSQAYVTMVHGSYVRRKLNRQGKDSGTSNYLAGEQSAQVNQELLIEVSSPRHLHCFGTLDRWYAMSRRTYAELSGCRMRAPSDILLPGP